MKQPIITHLERAYSYAHTAHQRGDALAGAAAGEIKTALEIIRAAEPLDGMQQRVLEPLAKLERH